MVKMNPVLSFGKVMRMCNLLGEHSDHLVMVQYVCRSSLGEQSLGMAFTCHSPAAPCG